MHSHTNLPGAFNQTEPREIFQQTKIDLTAKVDENDPQVVNITYPAAFSEEYIRPEVRLEIGPLASWVPSAAHIIRPYAYDLYPELFENPECPVVAISAERTFWEKATILHQEAHRPGLIPARHSRHYYDLYKLALSPIRGNALADISCFVTLSNSKPNSIPQLGRGTISRRQALSGCCVRMWST
jgi:hypothetical protein